VVAGQPKQKKKKKKLMRSHLKGKNLSIVVWIYIPASAKRKVAVQAGLGKKLDPISKITRAKRDGCVAQVVECLPSKCKGLSSNPSTE
jgi:hypothetical protein